MTDGPIPTLTRHNPYDTEGEGDPGKPLLLGYTAFAVGVFCLFLVVSWWGG